MRHPSYTFATLDAQAAVTRPPGPAPDLVRGRPPRATASTRTAAGRGSRPRPTLVASAGPRSGRHEVAPARWQGPPSPGTPVHLRARARRVLRRARSRRAGRRWTVRCGCSGATGRAPSRSVTGDHLDPPAADVAGGDPRAPASTQARTRPAGGSRWSPTCASAGYVFNPASFFLCRDARWHAADRGRRGPQHARRAPPVHAPPPRSGLGQTFVAAMDKAFYVSPFIEVRGGYAVRVRDEPARLRITDRPAPGRRVSRCTRASSSRDGP